MIKEEIIIKEIDDVYKIEKEKADRFKSESLYMLHYFLEDSLIFHGNWSQA